jgi:hypothetical protein
VGQEQSPGGFGSATQGIDRLVDDLINVHIEQWGEFNSDKGEGSEPEALYTVRFELADLWGADTEPGGLYIDLWDSYLGAAR